MKNGRINILLLLAVGHVQITQHNQSNSFPYAKLFHHDHSDSVSQLCFLDCVQLEAAFSDLSV